MVKETGQAQTSLTLLSYTLLLHGKALNIGMEERVFSLGYNNG